MNTKYSTKILHDINYKSKCQQPYYISSILGFEKMQKRKKL